MFVAVKPVSNTAVVAFPNNKSLQRWHKFSKVTDSVRDVDGVASSKPDTTAKAEITAMLAVPAAGDAATQLTSYSVLARTSSAAAVLPILCQFLPILL